MRHESSCTIVTKDLLNVRPDLPNIVTCPEPNYQGAGADQSHQQTFSSLTEITTAN